MAETVLLLVGVPPEAAAEIEKGVRAARDTARVSTEATADAGLNVLRQLKERGAAVAVLLVAEPLAGMPAREFLEQAASLFPDAKRVIQAAGAAGSEPAAGNGVRVDAVVSPSAEASESSVLPVLCELLDAWQVECGPPLGEVRVVGFQWSREAHEVKDFLARNRVPYVWMDLEQDRAARPLIEKSGTDGRGLPLLLFPDGTYLARPSDAEIAEKIGLSTEAESPFYDLVIVGGGPAGLAAAVYGASEGLRTIIVEKEAPGGQAGQSARIENYLGFPEGLSGGELAQRAVAQAKRFGVEILAARSATGLRGDGRYHFVSLDDGAELACHTLLLATGVSWRILDAPGCTRLVGAGVYYGAASAEAAAFRGDDVYVLGGGNSAGQAVMLLARYARKVTMLVMEESITERMSKYLVDRIEAMPNVEVRTHTTVVEAHGEGKLESITIRDLESGSCETVLGSALFVFIGASPDTGWLDGAVARDEKGFILCGGEMLREHQMPRAWPLEREPYLLETSAPGVFVAGDARAGSVKRVASAVGEGSMAIQFIHHYLRDR